MTVFVEERQSCKFLFADIERTHGDLCSEGISYGLVSDIMSEEICVTPNLTGIDKYYGTKIHGFYLKRNKLMRDGKEVKTVTEHHVLNKIYQHLTLLNGERFLVFYGNDALTIGSAMIRNKHFKLDEVCSGIIDASVFFKSHLRLENPPKLSKLVEEYGTEEIKNFKWHSAREDAYALSILVQTFYGAFFTWVKKEISEGGRGLISVEHLLYHLKTKKMKYKTQNLLFLTERPEN